MKKAKKLLSVVMSVLMVGSLIIGTAASAYAAEDNIGSYDYQITNPYKDVNWDTWKAYKSATHVHTVRSDGKEELDDMIEQYYSLGYQSLALTDHGTVNYSWTEDQTRLAIFGYQYFVHGNIDEISKERYYQITTGSDRNGNGMSEIPLGIELNGASTAKCHVNSYFADCGHGDLEMDSTWPEDAIRKSQAAGGVCHINHVGEWTDGKSDIGTYNAAFVSKFANLFVNYSSLVGMELVNTSDNRTRNDRYLYDESLKVTAPKGVNIFGFCEDDSHYLDDCGKNAQYFMLESNNAANIRKAMETGAFFACSKNAKTANELGDGFTATGDFPMVSRINIDEATDRISINAYNGNVIKMVSNGNVVAQKAISYDNQTVTFDLNEYEESIGSYVRFYITGAGGICYVQPFLLSKSAYKTSTVQFVLPSSDTTVVVKNSNGTIVAPVDDNNYYKLDAGTYSYTATRNGYQTKTETFTVSSQDITSGRQIKINVSLYLDLGAVSTYFYVPETIYLKPTSNGYATEFQYYIDRANAVDGALTKSATDTTGGVFFYCNKATSVTIKAENASVISNGSANFVNGYTVNSNTVSTEIKSGSIASVFSGNGSVIKWTATYTLTSGETRTAYAFSYVYSPNINEAAAGMRQVHTYSTDVFNQGILYMVGSNSVTGGSYTCAKNFFTDVAPKSNTGIANWFSSSANGGVNFGNHSHSSNASDSHTVTGGTATVYVDSSRTTNLNQIPNLQVGMWQCDIDGDSCITGYVNMTADNSTTRLTNLNAGLGSVYSSKISYANNIGASGTKDIKISAYTQTLRGKRQNNNNYVVSLQAKYISKDALRVAYNDAIRDVANMGTLSSNYINTLCNAGAVLGNPTATSSQIEVALNQLRAF